MSQEFQPGDFLVFQVESGFALLRVLDVESGQAEPVWHLAVYRDLYFDVYTAEQAASLPSQLQIDMPHVALTNRAFESTQVSRLGNVTLKENELTAYRDWVDSSTRDINDRSIRLILGMR
jgi:hypothetical protein